MDVFEIAKEMELEGKKLYEEQAKKAEDEAIKKILIMLANQEQDHYDIFNALQKNQPVKIKKESFKGIKDVFSDLRKDLPQDQIAFYNKILDIEKKSQQFYEEISQQQEPEAKEIIQRIANEEHKHWIIIKNLIDYIKRPDQWVEDPEFYHLEDY